MPGASVLMRRPGGIHRPWRAREERWFFRGKFSVSSVQVPGWFSWIAACEQIFLDGDLPAFSEGGVGVGLCLRGSDGFELFRVPVEALAEAVGCIPQENGLSHGE